MVKLQILLHRTWRNAEGADRVKRIAASLGINPTASGTASISGEIDPQAFQSLFGRPASPVSPAAPGPGDFGSPGGCASPDLPVPAPLQNYVESITVAPPYIRMNDR